MGCSGRWAPARPSAGPARLLLPRAADSWHPSRRCPPWSCGWRYYSCCCSCCARPDGAGPFTMQRARQLRKVAFRGAFSMRGQAGRIGNRALITPEGCTAHSGSTRHHPASSGRQGRSVSTHGQLKLARRQPDGNRSCAPLAGRPGCTVTTQIAQSGMSATGSPKRCRSHADRRLSRPVRGYRLRSVVFPTPPSIDLGLRTAGDGTDAAGKPTA
jgi:hypothetical protein